MIEKIILDYLNDKAPVPAYMEKPNTEPTQYILIEKTGSERSNYIDSATIAIQTYADSLFAAATLNEEVKTIMYDITELDEVFSVRLVRDYNFTDTTKKKYRYQAIFDLVF